MARQINRRSRLGPPSDPIGLTSEAPFLPVDSIQNMIPVQTRLESERSTWLDRVSRHHSNLAGLESKSPMC